jgi:NADH pyrophosphatase NudC (nudix superfamily)
MTFDPHIVVLAAATTGVGLLMSLAGLQKSALEWKRRRRVCPSCGHEVRGGLCGCS